MTEALRPVPGLRQVGGVAGLGIFMDDQGAEAELKRLRAEYGRWCAAVEKAGLKNPISLRGWTIQWRQRAEEEFATLKREATARKWTVDDFIPAVGRLLESRGFLFGDIEHLADTWAWAMETAVHVADAPSPFDTSARQHHNEASAAGQSEPPGPCQCGAVASWTRHLSWHLDLRVRNHDKPLTTFVCERPGCGGLLRYGDLDEGLGKPEPRWIPCSRCRAQMCLDCGAVKRAQLLEQSKKVGDLGVRCAYELSSGNVVPGSAPFRTASRRLGFRDRKLSDIYLDAHARKLADSRAGAEPIDDDFADGETEAELLDRIRDAGLTPGCSEKTVWWRRQRQREQGGGKESLFRDLIRRHDQDDLLLPSKRQVARPRFTYISVEDLGDEWFTKRNRELYDMAAALAEKWFGDVDFPEDYEGSPWLEDLKPQLVHYANEIAHEDPLTSPWDTVLKDRRQRRWLVVGVLAQIIERKIFGELLFGATKAQSEELENLDRATLRSDGYKRKVLFAELATNYLSSSSSSSSSASNVLPLDFWSSVDKLTAHTLQMLLPLVNTLCYFRPPSQWTPLLPLYEDLHALLAHAGFLSVQMRRSPDTVFHVQSATPGARMDYPNEGQASYELYRASRDEARKRDLAAERETETGPHRDAHHRRLRGAKVKLAVWPGIKRYHPLRAGGGETEVHPRATASEYARRGEGQRVVEIGKVVVIYYQGLIYPPAEGGEEPGALDGDTLLHHIDKERRAAKLRWKGRYGQMWYSIALTLASLACLYRGSILRGSLELYASAQSLLADSLPGEFPRVTYESAVRRTTPFLPMVAGLTVLPAVFSPGYRQYYVLLVVAAVLWWFASWTLGVVSPLVSSVVAQPPPEESSSRRSLFSSFWTSS